MDKKEEIRIVKKAIKGKPDAYGQLISEYQKIKKSRMVSNMDNTRFNKRCK